MSKLVTRVIKANQLNLQNVPPKVLGVQALSPASLDVAEDVQLAANSDQLLESDLLEQPSAREEAAKILQETENMVKELLTSARQQVEDMLQQAREEAENIVLEARDEVDALKDQAREDGYRQGFNKAIQEASTQAENIRTEAVEVLEAAKAEHNNIISNSEEAMIGLVMGVAAKVIESEVTLRPELVGEMVRSAIHQATDREELVIRVHPEDVEYVNSLSEELRKETPGMRSLRIIPDTIVSRGGCVVETPGGSVDATLERQLSEIKEALMEVS